MNYIEIIGTLLGLLYLYLEYKVNPWLWIVGIIMPAVYIYVYYQAGLYADLGISVYYIIASVYGVFCWRAHRRKTDGIQQSKEAEEEKQHITSIPRRMYIPVFVICVALTLLLGFVLERFTDSNVPWADGMTTSLSIVAMWMLARKYVEQWLVWIVADLGCGALYIYKELYFTAGLYILYAVIAVAGYRKWRLLKEEE
ncbi:MAG: nicotinamide riboside transporter PnuC [Muribaculaceae bacterium]|nr:nicotinamide riboside transporter PnuC [Muribaculaceae bacterium]